MTKRKYHISAGDDNDDIINEIYGAPLKFVMENRDVRLIILNYLPTVRVKSLPAHAQTGRYFITIDSSKLVNEYDFSKQWMLSLANQSTSTLEDLNWIFYHSNRNRTFVLLNSGSQEETAESKYPNKRGTLVSPPIVEIQDLLMSLVTFDDLLNLAITELDDHQFAHQWIHYVGCHGYMLYPEWVFYAYNSTVFCQREKSFNTYIGRYWKKRQEAGCELPHQGLCSQQENICCHDAMHHYCREKNKTQCTELRECRCTCENCENAELQHNNHSTPHNCLTPDQWLCFNNWNPP